MKEPRLAGPSFLEDLARARRAEGAFHLWWLGQSGFLIQWEGRHLLLDPYLSDSLTRKYAATDKPHVRMTARVVDPRELDFIDLVTSSHNHTDHLDAETLGPLIEANPGLVVVVPAANLRFAAERLEVPPERLTPAAVGETVEAAGFRLDAVPAAHEELELDEEGRHRFVGYVVRFGRHTVYHSGDTVLYGGMAETLRRFEIDVALLPINGRAPERRVAGNLDGAEAAGLAREIGAGVVIPCHYDMFEFNTATPEEFTSACERLGQRYVLLENGERWTMGA